MDTVFDNLYSEEFRKQITKIIIKTVVFKADYEILVTLHRYKYFPNTKGNKEIKKMFSDRLSAVLFQRRTIAKYSAELYHQLNLYFLINRNIHPRLLQ